MERVDPNGYLRALAHQRVWPQREPSALDESTTTNKFYALFDGKEEDNEALKELFRRGAGSERAGDAATHLGQGHKLPRLAGSICPWIAHPLCAGTCTG